MTIRLREVLLGLHSLELGNAPVVVHASLSSFGQVEGGAATIINALASTFRAVLVPAFTYKTMIIPPVGPPANGLAYGTGQDANRMAEFFTPRMPVDPLIGLIPETLRRDPRAIHSSHPILSFAGINAREFISAQVHEEPLAPLASLEQAGGWVLLLGVNHTVNTSIHWAEKLAGRRTFIRWALTPKGVVECPSFPGCSAGFEMLAPDVERYARRSVIGNAWVQAFPMKMLFRAVITRLARDPLALLCQADDCGRCNAVRDAVRKEAGQ